VAPHGGIAIEDRAVRGHWEGDLLSGSKNNYIATLVERHTRYVMLAKVTNKDTQTVVSALIKQAKKLPHELYKSLTWTVAKNSRIIDDLRSRPTSTSTSAIRRALGSAAPMRTPTFAEAVLPERNRLVGVFASPIKKGRPSAQRTATGDLEVRNPSREI
jgi:hypothetical protein